MIEIREAVLEDCAAVVDAMTGEDKAVLVKGWGSDPLEIVLSSFNASDLCWTAFVDGKIAVVFGCAPTDRADTGSCWFVSTPALQGARVAFVRQSGVFIGEMLKHYKVLFNFVHKDNKKLIGWLRWSGFRLSEATDDFMSAVLFRGEE